MAKRNITYIKPEDPKFLRILKQEAGYDDVNHKFDEMQKDFVDDNDSELPQVVVLRPGDLTAEEAEIEKKRIETEESETKADLSIKPQFLPKSKRLGDRSEKKKRKSHESENKSKKTKQLLSFDIDENEEDIS